MPNESQIAGMLRRLRPAVRDQGGEAEGIAEHPDDLIVDASLHILVKDIGDLLVKHYGPFLWAVQPDQRGGIINILCLNFHNEWAYTIKTKLIQDDPRRREAIAAGGELLRRFRYPGRRFNLAMANAVPRGPDGRAIPDCSDMPASKRKAQAEAELAIAEGRATFVQIDGESFLHVKEK